MNRVLLVLVTVKLSVPLPACVQRSGSRVRLCVQFLRAQASFQAFICVIFFVVVLQQVVALAFFLSHRIKGSSFLSLHPVFVVVSRTRPKVFNKMLVST
jgi:hypothetical protein